MSDTLQNPALILRSRSARNGVSKDAPGRTEAFPIILRDAASRLLLRMRAAEVAVPSLGSAA
jgi:hypothetical protein